MDSALTVSGLTKTYPDFVLDSVSFSVPSGSIVGLIGENGAGKSTTINAALGLIRKESGRVSILGREDLDSDTREEIGVVFDGSNYPEILSPRKLNRIMKNIYRTWDEMAYFRLLGQFSLPPDKQIKQFSKGMKMKLAISAALSHHPKLLILDEATSGLDPVVRDEVVEMLNEFTRDEGHSILISSHIVSDLEKLCDYIAFLHKGKLLLCEEKDALLEEFGIIHCAPETLRELDASAVKGKKETAYGVEAIVKRNAVPVGMDVSPIGIEELFVFMVKEGK